MSTSIQETIVALATPPGRGSIGVIRVSGPKVKDIAKNIFKKIPVPRLATFSSFYDDADQIIDQGIALLFTAPNSFTGEDVLELQGHGGPVVLDCLIKRILQLGARLARPGEFSEQAFLNDKIDLAQAEAIADLIDASSAQAARSAIRSLQGEFSQKITDIVQALIQMRLYVEAAIDFPEEEIDFLSDGKIATDLQNLIFHLENIAAMAHQGALLRDGMTVVIAGKPNAGKSSLLNALSGKDIAIVTDTPGTTRDILRQQIIIDNLPLNIIDTAGLRESSDKIEQEGIRRAINEIKNADAILFIVDSNNPTNSAVVELTRTWLEQNFPEELKERIILIRNKIDLVGKQPKIEIKNNTTEISLSVKTQQGLPLLKEHLKKMIGFNATAENNFIARRRHLDAIARANKHLIKGQEQLQVYKAGELLAEELLQAQQALGEITGEFRADDLLGKIFSSFCIGK